MTKIFILKSVQTVLDKLTKLKKNCRTYFHSFPTLLRLTQSNQSDKKNNSHSQLQKVSKTLKPKYLQYST